MIYYWIFICILITCQVLARESFNNGDMTLEDFEIEQLAAMIARQHELNSEEYDPVIQYQFDPLPGGGRESLKQPYFAVNPSDPRFYFPSPIEEREEAEAELENNNNNFPIKSNERTMRGPNPEDGSVDLRGGGRAVFPPTTPVPRPNMILNAKRLTTTTSTTPTTLEPEMLPDTHARIIQEPVIPDSEDDIYFIAIVAGCSAAGIVTVIATGICWYKLQRSVKAAADVEYPAYGVTGPNKDVSPTSGDRKLAQSAQMYHYQHQKQQIIAMESRTANERRGSLSEAESEEENEEGDYTVYECPGLAPTGEMEVKNPMFLDDPTPASPKPDSK